MKYFFLCSLFVILIAETAAFSKEIVFDLSKKNPTINGVNLTALLNTSDPNYTEYPDSAASIEKCIKIIRKKLDEVVEALTYLTGEKPSMKGKKPSMAHDSSKVHRVSYSWGESISVDCSYTKGTSELQPIVSLPVLRIDDLSKSDNIKIIPAINDGVPFVVIKGYFNESPTSKIAPDEMLQYKNWRGLGLFMIWGGKTREYELTFIGKFQSGKENLNQLANQ